MIITNSEVSHRTFGVGTVVAQEGDIVTVRFSNEYGDKRFQYPTAFISFLILRDEVLKADVDSEIRQIKETERLARQKSDEEACKKREKERAAMLITKRAATKKKAPSKAKGKLKVTSTTRGDGLV